MPPWIRLWGWRRRGSKITDGGHSEEVPYLAQVGAKSYQMGAKSAGRRISHLGGCEWKFWMLAGLVYTLARGPRGNSPSPLPPNEQNFANFLSKTLCFHDFSRVAPLPQMAVLRPPKCITTFQGAPSPFRGRIQDRRSGRGTLPRGPWGAPKTIG